MSSAGQRPPAAARRGPAGVGLARIGFVRWRAADPSGGNRYDDELATGLRTLGHDVREYPVTGTWPVPSDAERAAFAPLLTAEQHWLVDNIVASAAPAELTAAVRSGARVVVLVHYFPSDDVALSQTDRRRLAASEHAALAAASAVVVTSEWAADEVRRRYGRADVRVAVPGTEPAALAPGSADHGGPPSLLWLGRLTTAKDPRTFVEALRRLRDLPWRAELVGPASAEPLLAAELRLRIAQSGLNGRLELGGPREDTALEQTWARTDLLVHTSRSETFGMVITEALARGIPALVATGTGAASAHGAGAMFPPGDDTALAAALRRWLTDPQLRARWRRDAERCRAGLPTWQDTARAVSAAIDG